MLVQNFIELCYEDLEILRFFWFSTVFYSGLYNTPVSEKKIGTYEILAPLFIYFLKMYNNCFA